MKFCRVDQTTLQMLIFMSRKGFKAEWVRAGFEPWTLTCALCGQYVLTHFLRSSVKVKVYMKLLLDVLQSQFLNSLLNLFRPYISGKKLLRILKA